MSLSADSVQAISGAAFSTFSVLHLATHFSAIISKSAHKKVYVPSRKFYQTPVIEVALGVALVVHGGSAIYKYYKRYKLRQKLKNNSNSSSSSSIDRTSPRTLNQYFGLFLLMVIPLHIFGARITQLRIVGREITNKFDGSQIYLLLQSSMYNTGVKIFFSILYTLGLYHTVYGLNICYQRLFKTKPLINTKSKVLSYGILAAGSVIISLSLKSYRGERYDVNISHEQKTLFAPVIVEIDATH